MTKTTAIRVAWISAAGVVAAALITGLFQLFAGINGRSQQATIRDAGQSVQQQMHDSPGAVQVGGDLNVTVAPEVKGQPPATVTKFPFETQVARAKARIKYLADEYLQTDRMSLAEVVGPYGDNVLDSPKLYDWPRVLKELERQGLIRILERSEGNIAFRVIRSSSRWDPA